MANRSLSPALAPSSRSTSPLSRIADLRSLMGVIVGLMFWTIGRHVPFEWRWTASAHLSEEC